MSDFEIMQKMCESNQDISMTGTLVECKKVKKGGHITMGVDDEAFYKVINSAMGREGYYVALYVINKEQFQSYKNQNPELLEEANK